nr:ankyrin repeat domain-containing protein [Sedimentitalea sp. CY04]
MNLAAYYRKTSTIVEHLIQSGADVEHRSELGQTPLLEASFGNGSTRSIAALLEAGADVNAQTPDGWTPLLFAARDNPKPADIRLLVDAGADIEAMAEDQFSGTPIMWSILNSNAAITKALIDAGANPDRLTPEESTAFILALNVKEYQRALLLIDAGVDPLNGMSPDDAFSYVSQFVSAYDRPPLKLIKAMLDTGAIQKPEHKGELIFSVLKDSYPNLDRQLFELIMERKLTIADPKGNSLLVEAIDVELSAQDIIRLASQGADVNRHSAPKNDSLGKPEWETPLTRAAGLQDEDYALSVVRTLISASAQINRTNSSGDTPLHEAVFRGNAKIAKYLIQSNAQLNLRNAADDTAYTQYIRYMTFSKKPIPPHMKSVLKKLEAYR